MDKITSFFARGNISTILLWTGITVGGLGLSAAGAATATMLKNPLMYILLALGILMTAGGLTGLVSNIRWRRLRNEKYSSIPM